MRALPYLPPALLCLVAIQQVVLTRTMDLTPWKGGGFGMFSTNDGENRRVRITIEGADGDRQLDVTDDYQAIRLAAFPTENRLRAFARRVGTFQRSQGVELTRVRAAVWRTEFDPQDMEPRPVLLRETTVDFPARASAP